MKYTTEEIIAKARKVHGDKYEYGEYLGYNTKMRIICPIHGEFFQTPHDHLFGHGCSKCFDEKRWKNRQMDTESFIRKAVEKYGDSYDYSMVEYVDSKTKVRIKCNKCGNVFEQRPAKHLNANGCPVCAKLRCREKQAKTYEQFVEEARKIHGNKYDYSQFKYVNSKTPSTIICKIHGPFKQCANRHITAAQGCPKCGQIRCIEKTTMSRDEFVEKAKRVFGGKYSYDNAEYVNYHTKLKVTCKKHGDFEVTPCNHIQNESGCPKCVNQRSKWEKEVFEFVASEVTDVEFSNRKILDGKELDIFIPSKKIAIECDGLAWHNEQHKDKMFHLEKTIKAQESGIRLIHIFEDEWIHKSDIVMSMLNNILGNTKNKIYARKCEVRLVSPSDKKKFIDENHIQGDAQSKVNVGLYYLNELVSVMTFGIPRVNMGGDKSDGYWELVRFCNKKNTRIVGGASKLLSYFRKNYDYKRIVSYCDKRWSDGKLYEKLGFIHDHDSRPNYFYVFGTRRKNRYLFRKDKLIKEGYDSNKTEHEIMLERKIYRIYDCGTKVYYFQK